jgi:hypothetical protein
MSDGKVRDRVVAWGLSKGVGGGGEITTLNVSSANRIPVSI